MKTYFTITAGRTGSNWLANFLSLNLQVQAIHEPLGIDDFGVKMPDIRTMRSFNNYGNNEFVQSFWKRKFDTLSDSTYVETNHTLAKCGLVENIAESNLSDDTTLIVLKRDIVKQCVSYLVRGDFGNITIPWQWYLHPSYKIKIIPPKIFHGAGGLATPLWYCYEMLARQEYYRQKYSDRIKMVEINLEEVTKEEGASKFLECLDIKTEIKLPPPSNQNKSKAPEQLVTKISKIVGAVKLDMERIVKKEIADGFSFDPK
nr:hypothetical protein [uncultured Cohaesibacter sp.]